MAQVHTPLVKSRQGDMYCVCCEMDVKKESDAVGMSPTPPQGTLVETRTGGVLCVHVLEKKWCKGQGVLGG